MENTIKKTIVKYSRLLEQRGFVNSLEGNISIIDREKNLLYITPTTKRKLDLTENMIAILKEHEQVGGDLKRSSEYLLHKAALEAREDCTAAIHSHSPYLTAYAFCNKPIEMNSSTTFLLAINKIPCLPYGQPGTEEIHDGIKEALKETNIILLANHGVLCVGKDMDSCSATIETAENVMKSYYIAQRIGNPQDIPEDKIESLFDNHPSMQCK